MDVAMRALTALLLTLATLAGGCLGDEDDGEPGGAPAGGTAFVAGAACGTPVFGGIRGREVDVAVDPNDRSRVAAAAMLTPPPMRDLPAGSDVALWNALARSEDGGLTWRTTMLPYWPGDTSGTHPAFVGAAGFGDPILSFAPNGDLYLGSIVLTGLLQYNMVSLRFPGDSLEADTITVFSRGGYREELNMVPGVNPVGYNDKNDQAVDPETGDWYVSWMWRSNASPAGISTVPVVVRSPDGGATWSTPAMLVDSPLGGVTSGETNLAPAPLILGDSVIVLWSRPGDGIWAAAAPRGTLAFGAPYRVADLPAGSGSAGNVLTLPMINVATGPGPRGLGERAYVTAILGGDGHDVGLWWSDDGLSWTGPLTPHAATAGDQLVPTVAVAPDGRVAVQFIDFGADPAGGYHAVMSVSADGGATWAETRMTAQPTDSANAGDAVQSHVGDYFGNAFTSAGLLGAWQDGRDGTADAKFSEIYSCVLVQA
jgi:hypothetical protein